MFLKSEETVSRILQSVGTGDLNMFRDVRIRCSGAGARSESVFCHQTILSTFSPFLASLLASSCSCKSDINIILQDVDIQTVQALMGILYTGTLRVRGENTKSDVLSVAAMLGLDLNNFNIEEVSGLEPGPSYSANGLQVKSGLRVSPVAAASNGKRSEEVLPGENPPKKKRGRPKKVRTEEEGESVKKRTKKPKKSSDEIREESSSPDIFYHVTNPTFTIKAADKKALKKKGRKRKAAEVAASAPVIPEISLTFDLGGDSSGIRDRTINLQQLAQPRPLKKGRKKKAECQDVESSTQNGDHSHHSTTEDDKNEKITFASPEEVLESMEAADEAARNYSSDEENALVMDLSTGSI